MRWLALLIPLVMSVPAAAVPSPEATAYFQAHDAARVVAVATVEEARAVSARMSGELVEVRGTVGAVVGFPGRSVLLVHTSGQRRGLRIALPDGEPSTEWVETNEVTVGGNLVRPTFRFLCRPPVAEGVADTLQLVASLNENAALGFEQERRDQEKSAPPPAAVAPAPPQTLRARIVEPDLVQLYAGAIRYFNRQVPVEDAEVVARRTIAESRTRGLDARLLLAVLATEGSFQHIEGRGPSVFIGTRPAWTVVAATSTDLSRRLQRTANLPLTEALPRALAARRRDLSPGRVSHAEAQQYVERVTRLYAAINGTEVSGTPPAPVLIRAKAFRADREARWKSRRWTVPPTSVVGTWEGVGESFVVVINANGSGVTGSHGEQIGLWRESGGYLEFRTGRVEPIRFRWKVSDDRKALTVTRVRPDQTVVGTTTLLRR